MAGLIRRELHGEAADVFGRFDRLFEEWTRMMPFWLMPFPRPRDGGDLIRVEEFQEDGALVIRADLPGIDPDRDVEVTIADGMLHIDAQRRVEEKEEEKGYVRQELRYGALSRVLPLPGGATEADITGTYKDGVLEIRVLAPKRGGTAKVAISRS